jgi:hypothetical protein
MQKALAVLYRGLHRDGEALAVEAELRLDATGPNSPAQNGNGSTVINEGKP